MYINELKLKMEIILNKDLYINNYGNIVDEFNSFEISLNENGSIDVLNVDRHFNDGVDFLIEFGRLSKENCDQETIYRTYVNLLGYDKLLLGNNIDRVKLTEHNKKEYLDILMYDNDDFVLKSVASTGYKLEYFAESQNSTLRFIAAKMGYSSEELARDKSYGVRSQMAKNNHYLNILKDDHDEHVRCIIAEKGCYLNQFKDDPSPLVRKIVASKGYDLDVLIKSTGESSNDIKNACKQFMMNNNIKDIREYKKNKEYWCENAIDYKSPYHEECSRF